MFQLQCHIILYLWLWENNLCKPQFTQCQNGDNGYNNIEWYNNTGIK